MSMNVKKKRILIAEDYVFTQRLIQAILEKNEYEVVGVANNGREAIRLYQKLKPDLITMDMNMPEMNGLQAIEKIISMDPDAKIIALTGYNKIEVKTRKLGARGFVSKPFEEKDLIGEVEKLLYPAGTFDIKEEVAEIEEDVLEEKEEIYEDFDRHTAEEEEVMETEKEVSYDFTSIWNSTEESFPTLSPPLPPIIEELADTEDELPSEEFIPNIFSSIFSENEVETEAPEIELFTDKEPPALSSAVIYEEDDDDDLLGGTGVRTAPQKITPVYISEHEVEEEEEEEELHEEPGEISEEIPAYVPEEILEKISGETYTAEIPVEEYPNYEIFTPVYEPEVQEIFKTPIVPEEEVLEEDEEEMDDDDSFELPALNIDERLQRLSAYERGEIEGKEDVGGEAPGRADLSKIDIFSQSEEALEEERKVPLVVRPPMRVGEKQEKRLGEDTFSNDKEVSWKDYMTLEDEKQEKKGLFGGLFSKSKKKK